MKSEFISVIIPSGRADRVFLTVDMLCQQSVDSAQYEIVVVTPEPAKMKSLERFNVRVQAVDRLYAPGKMRNIGANVASGEILFL